MFFIYLWVCNLEGRLGEFIYNIFRIVILFVFMRKSFNGIWKMWIISVIFLVLSSSYGRILPKISKLIVISVILNLVEIPECPCSAM